LKIIILGAGTVGSTLAVLLSQEDNDITVVDKDESVLRHLEEEADISTLTGRCSYPNNLVNSGIKEADMVVAVTGSDEVNIVSCLISKVLSSKVKTIARIRESAYLKDKTKKAMEEGVALAEMIAGQSAHVNYDVIPGVVYTQPEIASVGRTEQDLKEAGIDYRSGKFPFTANGRAKANQQTEGFVKILADAKTDRVLGVHIIGTQAGEMIHEAVAIMEFGGAAEDIARMCHAHPTLSEAMKEAALAVDGRPLHM